MTDNRLVQYEGPRSLVEEQLKNSIHGMRYGLARSIGHVLITAVTLDEFPRMLQEAERTPDPQMVVDLRRQISDLQAKLRHLTGGVYVAS